MKALKITLLLAVFVLTFSAISSTDSQTKNVDQETIELKKSESSNLLAADRKGKKPNNQQA